MAKMRRRIGRRLSPDCHEMNSRRHLLQCNPKATGTPAGEMIGSRLRSAVGHCVEMKPLLSRKNAPIPRPLRLDFDDPWETTQPRATKPAPE
jgi:hypothetical protein